MIIWQIIAILLLFTAVVGVHELGHFLFARWRGMEVEEFAIGFGKPILWSRVDRHGTRFSLRAIPLGGFVRIKGMEPKADASETKVENGFYSKGLSARALVLFAGPLFSFLGGYVFFFSGYAAFGDTVAAPTVGAIGADTPAEEIGLQIGDRFLVVDRQQIESFYDLQVAIGGAADREIPVLIEREGEQVQLVATPQPREVERIRPDGLPLIGPDGEPVKETMGTLGFNPGIKSVSVSVPQAASMAAERSWMIISLTTKALMNPRTLKDKAGGPIAIGGFAATAAAQSPHTLFFIAAIISLSLGIINLLPIPPLDGGQLVITGVEALRRGRRLSLKAQEAIMTAGVIFVLFLIASVFWLDISRIINPPS